MSIISSIKTLYSRMNLAHSWIVPRRRLPQPAPVDPAGIAAGLMPTAASVVGFHSVSVEVPFHVHTCYVRQRTEGPFSNRYKRGCLARQGALLPRQQANV
jgi:hypothetical protein